MNLNLDIDPKLSKKAIVFSFERSGTHFLMNTLEKNFGYTAYPWVNLDYETGINFYNTHNLEHFFNQFSGIQVKNIFKSHHTFDFMDAIFPFLLKEFHVFYIYRNPLDTLISYWNYSKNTPWHEAPESETILDFISSQPQGAMLRYQVHQTKSILKRWEHYVLGWLTAIKNNGGIPVYYDDLNNNFTATVKALGEKLHINIAQPTRPEKHINVVQPNTKAYTISPDMKAACRTLIKSEVNNTLEQFNISLLSSNFINS